MRVLFACVFGLFALSASSAFAALALGTLVHDGPATPEQISLYLPVTGSLVDTATATVHYREGTTGTQYLGHPLHRIRSDFSETAVPDAFAGVITGLRPNATYTVEVSISDGITTGVQTLTATTRAFPPAAGAANKTIAAGSSLTQIQSVFDSLNPGDVLEFADGTYDVDGLVLDRSGSSTQPIYVRGASRTGVVLQGGTDRVLYFIDASDIVLENLTLSGCGVDSGTASSSEGVRFWDGLVQQRVTIRNLTMTGVDKAVVSDGELQGVMVYDCTLRGNNIWQQSFLESNLAWNDDGLRLPGRGNVGFNNTLSGFGDAFAVNDGVENAGVHFYRNDVLWTNDDGFESDYGFRNITFYDNRIQNSMTFLSCDPMRGGPLFVFRNISLNTGRGPYKLNNTNTGHFIYNNTLVRTNGYSSGSGWGWVQYNNGEQRAWGYRNNLLIYRGTGNLFAMESGGQDPIDFTNNCWYPDSGVWWTNSGGSFASVSLARSSLAATSPVFGTSTHRHENDLICESDPFATPITLGADYLTKLTSPQVPTLSPTSVAHNAGIAIPGITDGFTGAAPDMGAIIGGLPLPAWGDRSGGTGIKTPKAPNHLLVQ